MVERPLVDDQGNRILDDQGNSILVDDGQAASGTNKAHWWMALMRVPWGGGSSYVPPDPPTPPANRWVWADGDVHTWANGEIATFNEEP